MFKSETIKQIDDCQTTGVPNHVLLEEHSIGLHRVEKQSGSVARIENSRAEI